MEKKMENSIKGLDMSYSLNSKRGLYREFHGGVLGLLTGILGV